MSGDGVGGMTDPILAELRVIRLAAGLRSRDVAAQAGLANASLSRWEMGHGSPNLAKLRRLLDVLGCDLAVVPKEES